jgi:hypothetical protein
MNLEYVHTYIHMYLEILTSLFSKQMYTYVCIWSSWHLYLVNKCIHTYACMYLEFLTSLSNQKCTWSFRYVFSIRKKYTSAEFFSWPKIT